MSEPDEGSNGSGGLLDMLPTEKLTEVAETLLKTMAGKAVDVAIDQVESLTARLTDVADNGGQGLGSALRGSSGGDGVGGDSVRDTLKSGFSTLSSGVGDKVKGALGMSTDGSDGSDGGDGGGGGGAGGSAGSSGKFKFMNITEGMDVGVPLRTAYDQWTQFADFPSFMKKVETVEQESDEKTNWKAQVMWSHRSWEATIVEQVPDTHIIWRSTGAKGYADGIVSFHELAPNLTRILLVLQYYPQGFVEKTGNLWRAVGRRARLEFKHFCRHLSMETLLTPQEDLIGWRGEIRDSEVVQTHEEAIEEEQAAADEDVAPDGDTAEHAANEEEDADASTDDDLDDDLDEDDLDDGDADADDPAGEADDQADDQGDDQADDQADDQGDDGEEAEGERKRPSSSRTKRRSRSSDGAGEGGGRRGTRRAAQA